MGRPKESLPLGDTTMLGWQCRTLLACAAPVVVIGRGAGQQLPPLPADVDVVSDELPGEGPLAAIAAGFRHSSAISVTVCLPSTRARTWSRCWYDRTR